MPDYSTIALSGVFSLIVSWSTVAVRFWLRDRRDRKEWLHELHSLVARVNSRTGTLLMADTENSFSHPEGKAELEGTRQLEDLDNWVQQIQSLVTNPPYDVDPNIPAAGEFAVEAYDRFRYTTSPTPEEHEERLNDFLYHLNELHKKLEGENERMVGFGARP